MELRLELQASSKRPFVLKAIYHTVDFQSTLVPKKVLPRASFFSTMGHLAKSWIRRRVAGSKAYS
jgi:hypothetical protein